MSKWPLVSLTAAVRDRSRTSCTQNRLIKQLLPLYPDIRNL